MTGAGKAVTFQVYYQDYKSSRIILTSGSNCTSSTVSAKIVYIGFLNYLQR
ncbi:hypothetical protein [Sulfurisphaera ohwakuensis]|uniref:Uncharacterized protein n=1 Tax=Sulfurisphaera ohwakuensis TaxID=69656 RepID=A0A7J9RUG6_SULOH|nr:hypothetical protein [Sulfurisphaera ohwakuensis]MBB5254627.1 hypothetical protein [Sulfurisphaera ohwakuensis]